MNEAKLVPAQLIGRALATDLNLHLPQRPRFPEGFSVIPLPDGLQVEGAAERQVFRGSAATTILPRIIRMLDGSKTLEEVAAAMELSPQAVHNAVSLLYSRGLLVDGGLDSQVDLSTIPASLLAFFRRSVDITRINRNEVEAIGRLQTMRLGLVGAAEHAAPLVAQLKAFGFRHVETYTTRPPEEATVDLFVALVSGQDDEGFLAALDDFCSAIHVPWLRVAFTGVVAEIGPYFERNDGRCYRCFAAGRTVHDIVDRASALRNGAWLSLAATEIVNLATKICEAVSNRAVLEFNLETWAQRKVYPPARPDCPICTTHPCPGGDAEVLASAYEQSIWFGPKHLFNRKTYQVHYRMSNLELQTDGKRYFSAVAEQLPAPADTPMAMGGYLQSLVEDDPVPRPGLDRDHLAGLLLRVGGIREVVPGQHVAKVQRWAPTGGNLGSVQVYVLVRQVSGLRPGIYFYQPHEQILARLASEQTQSDIEELVQCSVGPHDPDLAAALIMSGAMLRVADKYNALAYRILHLDAGVAIAQMGAVARSYGFRLQIPLRWNDDMLLRALGLHASLDPITGVALLYDGHEPAEKAGKDCAL